MDRLEERLGYSFHNKQLLLTALTHSSYTNERQGSGVECYERLEFLGDSVLGYVTAEFLYSHSPELPEGQMTRLRAELVCESSLCRVARAMDFGSFMRLGRGEERTGGRERPSILADMVEAVIAAMLLDSGMEQARAFIMKNILSGAEISGTHRTADYKTALQELVQREREQELRYEMIGESGPDHCKTFSFRVSVNGRALGEGSGRTKKEAEQMAAKQALEALSE